MEIEDMFIGMMEQLEAGKPADRGPLARYYRVLLTELEKMYAFYLLYILPSEESIQESAE